MAPALKRCLSFCLVGLACAWFLSMISGTGDWTGDSWPAVSALAHGHLSEYLSARAMMGPFATLVQAPFVALAGGGPESAYYWASLPCLLAVGALGLYLAGVAGRRGASATTRFLIAALCIVNPLTLEALRSGHPEELLTAAAAIGAVASAAEGHKWRTAILLGLALASKQWAVIAILPTLMALPARRVRVGLVAAAIAAVLMLPGLLAAPGSFSEVNHNAASSGRIVGPWSIWYPAATVTTEVHQVEGARLVAHVHESPSLVGQLSHPLIVLLAFLLPLGLALRRGRFHLSGGDAMALLALLALLRCALDPLDNLYYHEPLLLALIGWDALAPRGLPVRSLAGVAAALLFRHWSLNLTDVTAFNDVYIAVALAATVAISLALLSPSRWTHIRPASDRTDFLPEEAQISRIEGSGGWSIRGL